MADTPVVLPTPPKIFDFPISIGIAVLVIATMALLIISGKFDPTKGTLTVIILITVTFAAAVSFSLLFTVPQDEATAALVGALTLAFGGVVSYVFRKRNGNGDNH